jgi:hypothetical protein
VFEEKKEVVGPAEQTNSFEGVFSSSEKGEKVL